MHTRVFGSLAALTAIPGIGLLAGLAVAPDALVSLTIQQAACYSSLVCLGLVVVTLISALCDLGSE